MPKLFICDAFTLVICAKTVANYALLWCKTFSLKIWVCKIFEMKEHPREKQKKKKHKNRDHFGIKFPCPKCDYKATVMSSLNNHIKSKHEGKRRQCSQCDYDAFDKQTLLRHVNAIHLNIKPFQCDICDFKASQKGTVNSHVKRKHKMTGM